MTQFSNADSCRLTAAAIQMVSGADLEDNLKQAEKGIRQAVENGASLLVLPENFATFSLPDIATVARREQTADGPVRTFLSAMAAQYRVSLVGGSLPVWHAAEGKCLAASFFYDDNGREIARYNKIHLFDADVDDDEARYRESEKYSFGDEVVTVAAAGFRIGMAICYDLRFPELFRRQRQDGAQVLVLPSAFTYATGSKHWQVLLRARAIENQCYVIAANQGGWHDKRRTYGHSMIISPDGEIMAACEGGECVVTAQLDAGLLHSLRRKMPLEQHRRL